MNEGLSPAPASEDPLLDDAQIFKVNASALRQGAFGSGQSIVPSQGGWMLPAREQRSLDQRCLLNILDATLEGLAFTAAYTKPDQADEIFQPGDWFAALYQSINQTPLTQDAYATLCDQTQDWIGVQTASGGQALQLGPPLTLTLTSTHPDLASTQTAYHARRDPSHGFGPYEFACVNNKLTLTLSCKEWENALKQPAIVWLNHCLGVAAYQNFALEDRFAPAGGSWVHRWLEQIVTELCPGALLAAPGSPDWIEALSNAAAEARKRALAIFNKAGIEAPLLWFALWNESVYKSRRLILQLQGIAGRPFVLSELSLPKGMAASVNGSQRLRLSGRMDILFCTELPKWQNARPFEGASSLVLDFKTGQNMSLSASGIQKGNGLQVALYALALGALGASDIQFGVSAPQAPSPKLAKPQILADLQTFFQALARMQDSAVFGMTALSEFDPVTSDPLPLAILPVPADVLAIKRALSYPEFTSQ
jgi:hypothetical protein